MAKTKKIRIILIISFILLAALALGFSYDSVIGLSMTAADLLPVDNMDQSILEFSSHLPIMFMQVDANSLHSRETPPRAAIWYFDNGSVNRLTDTPSEVFSYATANFRGATSLHLPKMSYSLSFYEYGFHSERSVSFFDLEPLQEWALRSSYTDKSLLRDWFSYELAAMVLDWQPRGSMVQLFLQDYTSGLTLYEGVYYLCQYIPAAAQAGLNLGEFSLSDSVSIDFDGGGYLFQLDRAHPYSNFVQLPLYDVFISAYRIMYPSAADMTVQQEDRLRQEIAFYHHYLNSPDETSRLEHIDPDYHTYIDADTFINYIMVAELLKISDAGHASTYMHRPAGEKLKMGPLWDGDLSMGLYGFPSPPRPYYFHTIQFSLFSRFANNEELRAEFVDKWLEYRSSIWTDEQIFVLFDSMVAHLAEPAAQNAARWPELFNGETYILFNPEPYTTSWEEEIERMRSWLALRLAWLDEYVPQLLHKTPSEINEEYSMLIEE